MTESQVLSGPLRVAPVTTAPGQNQNGGGVDFELSLTRNTSANKITKAELGNSSVRTG